MSKFNSTPCKCTFTVNCIAALCVIRCAMDRFERVVSMKVMKLRSQETMTGRKEFIVMGTTSVCGESIQCKGKVNSPLVLVLSSQELIFNFIIFLQIRIFDVIEVIPEPGKPLTKNKIKVPVTIAHTPFSVYTA